MPPPTEFEGGFFGDYIGLSADEAAHPMWSGHADAELFVCRDSAGNVTQPPEVCTRAGENADVANDQNMYTRTLPVPLP